MRKTLITLLFVIFAVSITGTVQAKIQSISGFVGGTTSAPDNPSTAHLNYKKSKKGQAKSPAAVRENQRCDSSVYKYTCSRDLRGVGPACNGKFAACECIYGNKEVFCAYNQICSKYVCGSVCIACEGDPDARFEECPDGYSKDIVQCRWPLSLLNLGSCGKCDAACPEGYDLETKYCSKGHKIKMTASGCGKCIKE